MKYVLSADEIVAALRAYVQEKRTDLPVGNYTLNLRARSGGFGKPAEFMAELVFEQEEPPHA